MSGGSLGSSFFFLLIALVTVLPSSAAQRGPRGRSDASRISLPPPPPPEKNSVESALAARRSLRAYSTAALDIKEVSQLLWAAQGITSPDGKRTAPSAGALYPLEIYVLVGKVTSLESGVYHYQPAGHSLERRSAKDQRRAIARAAHGQSWVAEAPAVVVIAGVVSRTARKYGARAERYVEIECGAAAENLALEAVALGLGTVPVGAFDDNAVAQVLGLPAGEKPLLILPVGKPR